MKKAIYSLVFTSLFVMLFTGCGASNSMVHLAGDGKLKKLKQKLQEGGDINEKNYSYTPIVSAARSGHLEVVKFLIDNGASHKSEALVESAIDFNSNNIDIAKVLINNGADINYLNNGKTAIINASYNGDGDLVKFLVENGANVDPRVNNNYNIFELFLFNAHKRYGSAQEIEDKYNEIVDANKGNIAYNHRLMFAAPTVNLAKKFIEFEKEVRKIKGYRKARTPIFEYYLQSGNNYIMEAANYPFRSEVIKFWADNCVDLFAINRKALSIYQTAYKTAQYNPDKEVLKTIEDLMKNPPAHCQRATNRVKRNVIKN